MMGQAVDQQDRLFYEFNLDERVPATHLLRRIDAVLDLSWLRGELKPYYSHLRLPLDRSRVDDPHAAGWLLLFRPLGAPAVPRGRA